MASRWPQPRGRTFDKQRNLVLITVDGLRQQEFFGGIDEKLVGENQESLRSAYGRGSAAARREALMPFFWKTLAPTGVVLGNRSVGSAVKVANPPLVSPIPGTLSY